jgi:hypothetical protein
LTGIASDFAEIYCGKSAGAQVRHHALVIEDELDIAKLVKLHLQDRRCEVNLALDGIVD